MPKIAHAAAAGAVLVGLLAGCGGDGTTSTPSRTTDEQKAADNLAAQIIRSGSMSETSSSESAVTDEQATCIAEGAVDDVGLAELQGYGILTEDLRVDKSIQGVEMRAEHADALAGVFVECIDAEALFEERFVAGLPEGGSVAQRRACVDEAVGEGDVLEILSASFQGLRPAAYTRLQRAVSACAGDGGPGQ